MSQDKYQDMSPSLIEALKFFVKNELAMTDDEFAQTRIQYNRQTRELTVDFGDGLKNNPERTTALRQWVMGLPVTT
jgi:hypothetical protein